MNSTFTPTFTYRSTHSVTKYHMEVSGPTGSLDAPENRNTRNYDFTTLII